VHFAAIGIAVLSLLIWLGIFFFNGRFWQIWSSDADKDEVPVSPWPSVVAIVPARNEAATIAETVASLAAQDYAGDFHVLVVDDNSEDGTDKLARKASAHVGAADRLRVIAAPALPAGWTGKLWALQAGEEAAATIAPEFYWFTDADIVHAPGTLRKLVSRAEHDRLDLTSLMVLLQAQSFAEKLVIPAFLYFFLMLYPPRWIGNRKARTAGAAGGCILLRRSALAGIGGLAAIRSEVIDDCSLARAVKRNGGAVWMGLTRSSVSLRRYGGFADLRDMIARTAFTQLNYSALQLIGTLLGLFVTFISPVALAFSPDARVWAPALLAWCLLSASYLPTVVFYRLSPIWSPLLPLAAIFYSYATALSAVRCWLGRGGQWKGRTQASINPSLTRRDQNL
jgi:hopene-associated glycosyltransferase HpnB